MKINLAHLLSCLASTVWSSLVLTNISTIASCLSSGQSLTSLVLLLHHRSAPQVCAPAQLASEDVVVGSLALT
jgi:hypothetical protein